MADNQKPQEKSFEQWQDDAFSSVLSVTLDTTNPKRSNRTSLQSVGEELRSEGLAALITTSTLERVLVARLEEGVVAGSGVSVDGYLLSSWGAIQGVVSNLSGAKGKMLDPAVRDLRIGALGEAQRLLVSYIGLSLQMPDLFSPLGQPGQRIIADALLADDSQAQSSNPLAPHLPALLDQIVARFAGDGLPDVMAPVFRELGLRMVLPSNRSLLQPGFRHILQAVETLVAYREIAQAVPHMATFDPEDCDGRRMQTSTALGAFLALSAFPGSDESITKVYYLDAPARNAQDREALHSSLRTTVQFLQASLFGIFDKLVRSGAAERDLTLRFTLRTLATNALRSGMQVDLARVVDDGFADNLAAVWLRLSEPFTGDPQLRRIGRVDPDWVALRAMRSSNGSNGGDADAQGLDDEHAHIGTYWRELTRISADKEFVDSYLERTGKQGGGGGRAFGFICDCFFTTADALHLGPVATISRYLELLKRISRFKEDISRIQTAPEILTPVQRASLPLVVERWSSQLDDLKREKIALDAQIFDPRRLGSILVFYRFVMCFLLRQVDRGSAFPEKPFAMPAEEGNGIVPDRWRMLPQFLFEDVVEFVVFLAMHSPDTLIDSTLQLGRTEGLRTFEMIPVFAVVFLARPAYVGNPYMKAKLVDILHMLTYCDPREDSDYVDTNEAGSLAHPAVHLHPSISQFQSCLDHSAVSRTFLVPALLRFYVDIEQTGSSSQFYDKFNIRYYLARTLRALWARAPLYVEATRAFFLQSVGSSSPDSAGGSGAQQPAGAAGGAGTTTGSSRRDQQVIEEFVARLMTDTTYLLDESLSQLTTIRDTEKRQAEIAAAAAAAAAAGGEADEARDLAHRLQEAERIARSYVSLAHETVHMLAFLTRLAPKPFRAGEVVGRLAAMLNYNLKQLAGPKCSNLRVRNMAGRFAFNPRVLLSELTSVYVHLGLPPAAVEEDSDGGARHPANKSADTAAIDRFVASVVEDDRSYSATLFEEAYAILERRSLKSTASLGRLRLFARKCKAAKVDTRVTEFLEAQAPDAYLDPLLASLMTDPVRLPTSGNVMDRAAIKGQLLSDPRDPFNRAPLTADMLVPLPDLRNEIQLWRDAKLADYYESLRQDQDSV
ncbi:Ubiquitin conjugation factor E4 [Coemansia sp. RSA 1939]|nr:Ubiquitin conjugation factor E4 [Coemansia sp. RSA 1939]